MLNNLLKTVQTYAEEHKAIEEAYNQDKLQIAANYKGDLSKDQLAKATSRYMQSLQALKERTRNEIDSDVKATKSAIKAVIAKPLTSEQLNIIQTSKLMNEGNKLTRIEKQEIMNKCKDNYLATRILVDLFGMEYSPINLHADGLISRIDDAVKLINDSVINAKGFTSDRSSFTSAFVLKGDIINSVQTDVSSFVESFSE